MKKIIGLALCMAMAVLGVQAQNTYRRTADEQPAVLTDSELADVVLFTNGRAEKCIVLDINEGQPLRIVQADGMVHAYSPSVVDRVIRGCGMEILHVAEPGKTARPALPAEVGAAEPYDMSTGAVRRSHAVRKAATLRPAAAKPGAAVRPLAAAQPRAVRGVQPRKLRARAAAQPAQVRVRPARKATAAATQRVRPARGHKRR